MERQDIKRYIIIIYDLMDYIIATLVVKSRQSMFVLFFFILKTKNLSLGKCTNMVEKTHNLAQGYILQI